MKDKDFFISIIVGLVFIGLGVVCIYTLSGANGAMLASGCWFIGLLVWSFATQAPDPDLTEEAKKEKYGK